jgi:hypothetical protein
MEATKILQEARRHWRNLAFLVLAAVASVVAPVVLVAQTCTWECAKCTCNLNTGKCECSNCTIHCTQ